MIESEKPKGWRKAALISLVVLFGLLAGACFGTMPGTLGSFAEACRNASVPLPGMALLAIWLVETFQRSWWLFAAVQGGVGVFTQTGALDRLVKPMALLVTVLCLAVVALAVFVEVYFTPERLAGQMRDHLEWRLRK